MVFSDGYPDCDPNGANAIKSMPAVFIACQVRRAPQSPLRSLRPSVQTVDSLVIAAPEIVFEQKAAKGAKRKHSLRQRRRQSDRRFSSITDAPHVPLRFLPCLLFNQSVPCGT